MWQRRKAFAQRVSYRGGMKSPLRRLALGLLPALALASGARAELPPERPTTPYSATMRTVYQVDEPGHVESGGDTVEIRVSGQRLYEKSKIMEEKAVIVDMEARTVIEFVPDAAEKIAKRLTLGSQPIPYVRGRTSFAEWGEPTVAGEDKVAKRQCSLLHYGKPDEDGAAVCVDAEGLVLRAVVKFPGFERTIEALEVDTGEQDEKWFRPPKDYEVVDETTAAEPEAADSDSESESKAD